MRDHRIQEQLRYAFMAQSERCRTTSPVGAALCAGLSASPAVLEIFSRFFQIISAVVPHPALMLSGLHHLALQGEAPGVARFFPSCGGAFDPESDSESLIAAAEADLAENREAVLDYMLSNDPDVNEVQRSAAVLLGAAETAGLFGGGLSLVEVGCSGGLNLLFDRYAYRIGEQQVGSSPLLIEADLTIGGTGSPPPLQIPTIVGRRGMDLSPRDLTDPEEQLLMASYLWPDETARLQQLRGAAAILSAQGPPDLRHGAVEHHTEALLTEAYNDMDPGNTLLLYHTFVWSYLSDEQRRSFAHAVQRLAAQLKPHKPLAWLQVEPASQGAGLVEIKLHTFGWADQEDRTVRKLAEGTADLRSIRWVS